ncbi:MAG: competence/damage-inducible protein A [Pseudomonadota bacterium]
MVQESAGPTAAMLVIGDEILSGRTQDANAHHLAGRMSALGIPLREIRVVPDDHAVIVAAVKALSASNTYVFTSGGIGPTHDDITADAVAAAFDASIDVRADARALLEAYYAERGTELNAARLRMARIPEGARLIDNPVSVAPGFILGNVHVMAGVPSIFRAMLDGLEPGLKGGPPILSHGFEAMVPEGDLAASLGAAAEAHPAVSIGCYPFFHEKPAARVVLRSPDPAALAEAAGTVREAFQMLAGDAFKETPPVRSSDP